TMDKLRTHKVFRRHLRGAQNNDSDSSISTMGLQNLCSITAPVISGRRIMAANFPVSERRTTGSAVINDAVQRGASNVSDVPLRSHISTQAVSNVVNSSVRNDIYLNAPVFDTATTQSVAPIQSTPLYVSSNPYNYAYVNPNDVVAPSQADICHFDRREYVSTGRRPTVLPDSGLDDDSDVGYRPGEKPSYAAKTPRRPKPYEQSRSKRHDTVQWDENTLPKYRDSPEIQQLRGQFEQYSQVLQSISNRVVDQMKALIDTVSKKRKVRKTGLSTFEQLSASETETESAPQRHLIRP